MKKGMKIFLAIVLVLSLTATLAVSAGALYLSRYRDCKVDETLLTLDERNGETCFYYYEFTDRAERRGKAIKLDNADLNSGVKYRYTPLTEMPSHLINAFLAIEDKRFYDHKGIDPYRTASAVLHYICGTGNFGGSTITQQLVKNLTGQDEFSVERKLREGFSALNLEEELDKSRILELYLNIINLAEGCRGVGAAANFYFSKHPTDLTLSEAATIAAITNNPTYYDPIKHPAHNIKRRDLVLGCMRDQGYITEAEYNAAIGNPILLTVAESTRTDHVNSWYIDMVTEDVLSDLSAKYGISRRAASLMLYTGGYRIYTAMDPEIQSIVEDYYADELNFPIDESGDMPNAAMIVIDPYTGDILAVAGGVGEKNGNRLQNRATETLRPPGSTIKPLSVYGPALEKGLIRWSTVLPDEAVREENGRPWPQNFDRTYLGDVDIAYAVAHSLNTVPVRILDMLGKDSTLSFLREQLMIKSLDPKKDSGAAALALGQPTKGITLRELTAAYSIFFEGIMSKPRAYYKVTDSQGRVILDNAPMQNAVLSLESAAIMTKLLEGVVDNGTARGAVLLDKSVDVAGKSGTTTGNRDRYFIGYTPALLAGAWFGYDYPKDLSVFGGNLAVSFWDEVMTEIYEKTAYGQSKTRFSVPETVEHLTYDRKTGGPPQAYASPAELADGWFKRDE